MNAQTVGSTVGFSQFETPSHTIVGISCMPESNTILVLHQAAHKQDIQNINRRILDIAKNIEGVDIDPNNLTRLAVDSNLTIPFKPGTDIKAAVKELIDGMASAEPPLLSATNAQDAYTVLKIEPEISVGSGLEGKKIRS